MISAPIHYLQHLLQKLDSEKSLTSATQRLAEKEFNIHFVMPENDMDFGSLITSLTRRIRNDILQDGIKIPKGQHVIHAKAQRKRVCRVESPDRIRDLKSQGILQPVALNNYLPITGTATQIGSVKRHLCEFEAVYKPQGIQDYFNFTRLLVVASQQLFKSISTATPACFFPQSRVTEYNSSVFPKVVVLKHIDLLEDYLEQDCFGDYITFDTCIVIGGTYIQHNQASIKRFLHRGDFKRVLLFTATDAKVDLGNDYELLQWRWTTPEINHFNSIHPKSPEIIKIANSDFDRSITAFWQEVEQMERQFNVNLKDVYYHIRRLYFDWRLDEESNRYRAEAIKTEFAEKAEELLINVLLDAHPEVDYHQDLQRLISVYNELIQSLSANSKTKRASKGLKEYGHIVAPSFLVAGIEDKLRSQHAFDSRKAAQTANSLKALPRLKKAAQDEQQVRQIAVSSLNSFRPIHSTGCLITSIYGLGGVDKLIEKLCTLQCSSSLWLYGREEEAWNLYLNRYKEQLQEEYKSEDRFKISGIRFEDAYYQYSTFDELIEALTAKASEQTAIAEYKLTFGDNSSQFIPARRNVLKVSGVKKEAERVEDLAVGDKVQIYFNPDTAIVRRIVQGLYPEVAAQHRQYARLWQLCFREYFRNNPLITRVFLYQKLKENGFSVSEKRMVSYLEDGGGEDIFPRRNANLIAIAKTIQDERLSLEIIKTKVFRAKKEYSGKLNTYGLKLSDAINDYIQTGDKSEFITKYLTDTELQNIIAQLPEKTIKNIELVTAKEDNDE